MLPGSSSLEVTKAARKVYRQISSQSKRQPYIRSRYFNKEKVFVGSFWPHLLQKRRSDQVRRLKFFLCAIDLIRQTTALPISIAESQKPGSTLYRFEGLSSEGRHFYVQIIESNKTGRKDFISVFPK